MFGDVDQKEILKILCGEFCVPDYGSYKVTNIRKAVAYE